MAELSVAELSVVRSGHISMSGLLEIPNRSTLACSNGVVDLSGNAKMKEEKAWWRKLISHLGPGFLVSIAYMDPGNLESDFQAGAQYKFELLWVILVASGVALIIQSRAANLGVTTGKHLAEHCREEYPRKINYLLWLLAEVAVIAADIPEVLGTAFALNMLFHIPVWVGVLITGVSTLLLLGIQRYGIRKLEGFVALLVFIMFGCFFGELAYAKPEPKEVVKGLFVPQLNAHGATGLAISLLGSMVMPHNLFLHSALVLSRKETHPPSGIDSACRYFLMETGMALFIAFIINVAVITVSGSVCSSPSISPQDLKNCVDLDLNKASFLLKHVLGDWSSKVFALALLASGQSSTITGTYAGQYIMKGFLNLKIEAWLRNVITQCIAIIPSLVVSVIYGSSGAGKLIIISSIILSFELPFVLFPLLKFTSSKTKMGPHKSSTGIVVVAWSIGFCIIGINLYYLYTGFGEWLVHKSLTRAASVLIGLVVFSLMALYLVGVLYLAFRPDKKDTYVAPGKSSMQNPSNSELEFEILATD